MNETCQYCREPIGQMENRECGVPGHSGHHVRCCPDIRQQIRENLRSTRAVQAGWAFGVPEDGQETWLDIVVRAVMKAYS